MLHSSVLRCCCAALCGIALSFAGCKPKGGINTDDLRPAAGGRFYGGTYRVNESAEIRSLDPVAVNDVASAHITENIYDQLCYFDKDLKLTYEIAERREISDDGLRYTYFIRKGVRFHDNPCFPRGKGRELNAHDVVYSLNRCCDARAGTLGSEYFRGKVIGAEEYYAATRQSLKDGSTPRIKTVEGFVALDSFTVQIRLIKPFGPFEYYVALNNTGICPHEAVEKYGKDFFRNPVGTGPFQLARWQAEQECLLTRNPYYWKLDEYGNRLPYLDAVRYSYIKDEKIQLLEFREGNFEDSYRIPSEFFPSIVDANKNLKGSYRKFVLHRIPALSTQFYGMMTKSYLFKDKRIRQAFSYAIDRNRIARFVLKGQSGAIAEHGLVPPSMPGYGAEEIRGFGFDIGKARTLMAEAGYPNGKGFPTVTLQLNAGGGRNTQVAEAVQSMLTENLGITVHIKLVEFARHLDEIDHGRAPYYRLGWVADYPDPETFLNLFYGKPVPADTTALSPTNSTRYTNPAYDAIFEKAISTPNTAERLALYKQAEQLAVSDAPMMFIFHDEDYRLLQPYVRGYMQNPMDKRPYVGVWFDKTMLTR